MSGSAKHQSRGRESDKHDRGAGTAAGRQARMGQGTATTSAMPTTSAIPAAGVIPTAGVMHTAGVGPTAGVMPADRVTAQPAAKPTANPRLKATVVAALNEIGLLLELLGENPFKARAYYQGAWVIERLGGDISSSGGSSGVDGGGGRGSSSGGSGGDGSRGGDGGSGSGGSSGSGLGDRSSRQSPSDRDAEVAANSAVQTATHSTAQTAAISTAGCDLNCLVQSGRLGELPGIGAALQKKITELVTTGHLAYLDRLRAQVPPTLLTLLRVPGLGPRKVHALHAQLGINTLDELEAACRQGRLQNVAGFGRKTEARIMSGIAWLRQNGNQWLWIDAQAQAEQLVRYLLGSDEASASCTGGRCQPAVHELSQVVIAGELRRACEVVRSLELVASVMPTGPVAAKTAVTAAQTAETSVTPAGLMTARSVTVAAAKAIAKALARFPAVAQVEGEGENESEDQVGGEGEAEGKSKGKDDGRAGGKDEGQVPTESPPVVRAVLRSGLPVAVHVASGQQFGEVLIQATGNRAHVEALQRRARELGLGTDPNTGRNEEAAYAALGLQFVPPELREGQGEVETALAQQLPKLVRPEDVRGAIHVHTNASDGRATIEEMARAAAELGWEYLGISDHSQSAVYAHGLKPDVLLRQVEAIAELNRTHGFSHEPGRLSVGFCDRSGNGQGPGPMARPGLRPGPGPSSAMRSSTGTGTAAGPGTGTAAGSGTGTAAGPAAGPSTGSIRWPYLLAGVECDILPDGRLDYPDEVLKQLDFVVASVHGHFGLDREAMTARVVRAMGNPWVTVLGHPTGRVLLERPGYELDIDAVLQAAAEHGVAIEINASPHRLDVDWHWCLRARALGLSDKVWFWINPDAHSVAELSNVPLGVMVARKGWLTAAQIVNTRPLAQLRLRYVRD